MEYKTTTELRKRKKLLLGDNSKLICQEEIAKMPTAIVDTLLPYIFLSRKYVAIKTNKLTLAEK